MSKFDKLIQKINNLQDITFEEGKKVLNFYGYVDEAPKSGSSHITFRKQNREKITLVRTQKPLKPYAIKLIKEAINE